MHRTIISPNAPKTNLSAADLIMPNLATVRDNLKTMKTKPNHIERKERQMKLTMNINEKGLHLLKPLAGVLIGGLLLASGGCKTTRQQTKGTIEPSGFLGDYSEMQKGVKDRAELYYMRPGVDWAKYTKIWIKPIELWRSDDPDSPMGKISPENQQKLIDLLNTALITTLSTNYTIVDHGGPDVLIIHAAITDAKKSKPVIGFVSSAYLPLKVISVGKQALFGTAIGVGSVTIEAEFLDGESNQRLCAVVDSRSGTSALRSKFSGTFGDIEKSFEWWAERLDQRLMEEKSGSATKTAL
jgi:Protein of unknown function (DUF3313)